MCQPLTASMMIRDAAKCRSTIIARHDGWLYALVEVLFASLFTRRPRTSRARLAPPPRRDWLLSPDAKLCEVVGAEG